MLLDDNLVFLDSATPQTGFSKAVPLNAFWKPDREDPIPICLKIVDGDLTGVTALTVQLQQGCAAEGPWENVPPAKIVIDDSKALVQGKSLGWRFLPPAAKNWLRLSLTVTGTATGTGKIFAAVVREDEVPWENGMYIDGGVVKG